MKNSLAVIKVREHQSSKKENDQNEEDHENDTTKTGTYWDSLYGLLPLPIFIFLFSTFTLIPRKNSILYPEYWYEGILIFLVGSSLRITAYHILSLYTFTNAKYLTKLGHFVKVFVASSLFAVIPYVISYFIWTVYLENNHPLPLLALLVSWIEEFATNYFFFPFELRSQKDLKTQGKVYLIYEILHFFANHTTGDNQLVCIISASIGSSISDTVCERNEHLDFRKNC